LAQDDYYYEIQLTNKQLVFYFMAGATGLILSFLAGVMVGRGVDAASGEVQASRPAAEERVVEETPVPVPPGEDLTYAKRLEGEKVDESLDRAKPPVTPKSPAARPGGGEARTAAGHTRPAASDSRPPAEAPAAASSKPPAAESKPVGALSAKSAAVEAGSFTIQVGAFKDGASAESVVSRLKTKGFAAYVLSPAAPDGLFNVRVGTYRDRGEAEKIQVRLRDQEKFKPFIVKQ
jgi:DedD protein